MDHILPIYCIRHFHVPAQEFVQRVNRDIRKFLVVILRKGDAVPLLPLLLSGNIIRKIRLVSKEKLIYAA